MLRILLTVSFVFFARLASGQENIQEQIVGDWNSFLGGRDSVALHFKADGTMFTETSEGVAGKGDIKLNDGRTVRSLIRYTINTKTQPMQIDLYFAVDNHYNVVGKAEGIFELLDNNLLQIAMNFDGPKLVRPENFENPANTIFLKRRGREMQVADCERFREGNFKMVGAFTGTTRIARNKDIQIESNELGDKVKLRIEWISGCKYTLTPIEYYVNNQWTADTSGIVQTIQIIKVKKDSYIFSAENNKTDFRTIRELFLDGD